MQISFVILLGVSLLTIEEKNVGQKIDEAKVRDVIASAVPELELIAGDYSWAGGMFASAYIDGKSFNTNNFFGRYRAAEGQKLSAKKIAAKVRDQFTKEFKLPTEEPSGVYEGKPPEGFSDMNFGQAYLICYPQKVRNTGGIYMMTQVVGQGDGNYDITIFFTTVNQKIRIEPWEGR